jgi:hypothetical protein
MIDAAIQTKIREAGANTLSLPEHDYVQFSAPLTLRGYALLSEVFDAYPALWLRTYGFIGALRDLSFLKKIPTVRHISLEHTIVDWSGLADLPPKLISLAIQAERGTVPLAAVCACRDLQVLEFDAKPLSKDLSLLASLGALHSLRLSRCKLPDSVAHVIFSALPLLRKLRLSRVALDGTASLRVLHQLDALALYAVKGCSDLHESVHWPALKTLSLSLMTLDHFDGLEALSALESLSLNRVRGPRSFAPTSTLSQLRTVTLCGGDNITSLPAMHRWNHVEELAVGRLPGVRDLTPLRDLKAMHTLSVFEMPHLAVNDFSPLIGHPSLRTLRLGMGNIKKTGAVRALLELPPLS